MFYSLSTVGNICNTVASLRLVSPSATTDGVALFVSLKTDVLLSSAVFSVNSAAKKLISYRVSHPLDGVTWGGPLPPVTPLLSQKHSESADLRQGESGSEVQGFEFRIRVTSEI